MPSAVARALVKRAAAILKSARKPVALTGAGISTASGIPDFRSPGVGLWEKTDPMAVASLAAFRRSPEQFFEWVRPLAQTILSAKPNPAHLALARLEEAGHLAGIITQNIDDLHQKAGSKRVVEIHGSIRQATCVRCGQVHDTQPFLADFACGRAVPRCPACGGFLKPKAVLFGEMLPPDAFQEAEDLLAGCDLALVVGTSLEVTPAAYLPLAPLHRGARLIVVNREPTYLDGRAAVRLSDDAADVLPMLVCEVLDEQAIGTR